MKKRRDRHGEPDLPEDGWYGFGEDAIQAVDFTEGGAPYGPTRAEMRAVNERLESGAPWARAKSILRLAMSTLSPASSEIDVGRVIRLGDGLSRDAFGAAVEVSPDPSGLSGAYVVLLPGQDATSDLDTRAKQEIRLLQRLSKYELPFRIPRVLGAWPESGHRVVVRSFLEGVELDLRAGRQGRVQPWEIVAQLASAIHQLDAADFADVVPGHSTCQAHGEASLRIFEGLDAPAARDALAWAQRHLPPQSPAVLLHGDLLGQNILLAPGEPPGLIDWEYARRGDPAYDLAIVTRGKRRPFQIDGGLMRLLEAYSRFGGIPLEPVRVHFHELCLVAGWYRESLESPGGEPPDQTLSRLRNMLRRLGD